MAPQFAQGYIASHSSLFMVDSLVQLEELVSRRRKVDGSIPWDFFFFFAFDRLDGGCGWGHRLPVETSLI